MRIKIVLFLLIAASLNFWGLNYFTINPLASRILEILLIGYLLIDMLIYQRKYHGEFKYVVALLIIIPFLSSITCYIYRGQSIVSTVFVTRGELLWLLYYWLKNHEVKAQALIDVCVNMGLFVAFINIFEHISYPTFAPFGTALDSSHSEIDVRNGIERFTIQGIYYTFFAFYYYLYKWIGNKKIPMFFLTMFCFVGIYLTMTRQLMIALLAALIIYPLLFSKIRLRTKLFLIIFFIICGLLILSNITVLYGDDVIDMTENQLNNDNYVRWGAFAFYGYEYWEDWFNILLGNGMHQENAGSPYGDYIVYIYETFKWIHADIGIVGVFSRYGLLYVFVIIYMYGLLLFNLNRNYKFVAMVVLASLVTIAMVIWFRDHFLFSIILYLSEISISQSKLISQNDRHHSIKLQ